MRHSGGFSRRTGITNKAAETSALSPRGVGRAAALLLEHKTRGNFGRPVLQIRLSCAQINRSPFPECKPRRGNFLYSRSSVQKSLRGNARSPLFQARSTGARTNANVGAPPTNIVFSRELGRERLKSFDVKL